jgi:hypothetical protein
VTDQFQIQFQPSLHTTSRVYQCTLKSTQRPKLAFWETGFCTDTFHTNLLVNLDLNSLFVLVPDNSAVSYFLLDASCQPICLIQNTQSSSKTRTTSKFHSCWRPFPHPKNSKMQLLLFLLNNKGSAKHSAACN